MNVEIKPIEELSKKQMAKRDAIIAAAIEVFAHKGFHKAKVSDVAKKANVADGTVYLYFRNKDDLLMKAFEEMFSQKLEEMKKEVMKEPDVTKRMQRFFDLHVDLFTNNPSMVRFMAIELRQSPEFYEKYPDYWPYKSYMDFLQELIHEEIRVGHYRKIDPQALSYMVFGTVEFILTQWSVQQKTFSMNDIKEQVMDILRHGVLAD